MKYKWRRICAITGMIALCLFTPDIAEGNNSQDFESGTDIKSEISKERMLDIIRDISAAPRPVNSEQIQNVKEYIVKCFEDLGYEDIEYQRFEYNDANNENAIRRSSQADIFLAPTAEDAAADGSGENIIVTRHASADTDKNLIISAHYDSSLESTGANDNGSGVAAVIELARILKDADMPCNLKYIMFSGEEKYMLGSRWYAGNLSQSDQDNIVGVINIDSIAETSDLGYMVMVSGNKTSDDIVEYNEEDMEKLAELNKNEISDLFMENERFRLTMAMNSDHYPFSLLNIPAVSIVQDWENGLSVNDSSDMIENLDPDRLEEVVGLVLEVVFRL